VGWGGRWIIVGGDGNDRFKVLRVIVALLSEVENLHGGAWGWGGRWIIVGDDGNGRFRVLGVIVALLFGGPRRKVGDGGWIIAVGGGDRWG
jgi:hypothetical protein